jgi:hypothetical protein
MPTREIPRDQWTEFLDSLSRDFRLHPITVQVADPEVGFQTEMQQVPLVGVSADLHAGGGPRIEVMAGHTDLDHTTHSVSDPVAVRLEEDVQGQAQVLEIESRGGVKTLVILKPVAFGEPGTLVDTE